MARLTKEAEAMLKPLPCLSAILLFLNRKDNMVLTPFYPTRKSDK
jgi:hypothetical protein